MLRLMSRRVQALKPQINQIRIWARQGLTDAWIAHALETTPATISAFRAEHGIERGADEQVIPPISAEMVAADELPDGPLQPRRARKVAPVPVPDPDPGSDQGEAPARTRRRKRTPAEADAPEPAPAAAREPAPVAEAAGNDDPIESRPRRRSRGGRGRKRVAEPLTAQLQQGVVLVLDAAVLDDETFKTRWLEAGTLHAEIGEDAITLRRSSDA
jgi:hypothetical protein